MSFFRRAALSQNGEGVAPPYRFMRLLEHRLAKQIRRRPSRRSSGQRG